jgi:hypothetical protein
MEGTLKVMGLDMGSPLEGAVATAFTEKDGEVPIRLQLFWFHRGRPAAAVEAPMGGASPAGPLYLLPEGFPGSMEAHGHSIRCDTQMNRSVGEGLAAQVDGFKGLGLGRFKGGE